MLDAIVVLMQVVAAALLAWGAWLSLFRADRRRAGSRGAPMTGGRRRGDPGPRLADDPYAAPEGGMVKVPNLKQAA